MLALAAVLLGLSACGAPAHEPTTVLAAQEPTTRLVAARQENADTRFMSWFPIGMSPEDLLQAAQTHGIEIEFEPDDSWHLYVFYPRYQTANFTERFSGLSFNFSREEVPVIYEGLSAVRVHEPAYATPEGIRIGDSREKVNAIYESVQVADNMGDQYRPERNLVVKAFPPYEDTWLFFAFWDDDNPDLLTGWSYGYEGFWWHRN